jgi:hypothetical protein
VPLLKATTSRLDGEPESAWTGYGPDVRNGSRVRLPQRLPARQKSLQQQTSALHPIEYTTLVRVALGGRRNPYRGSIGVGGAPPRSMASPACSSSSSR